MKELGLLKGDCEEALKEGVYGLFYPHGLGHMLGLDVHDMESLGEDLVGYSEESKREAEFGITFLRLGKKLEPGFSITVEPGIYIPDEGFGVRLEDDVVIQKTGEPFNLMGNIPIEADEIEDLMNR